MRAKTQPSFLRRHVVALTLVLSVMLVLMLLWKWFSSPNVLPIRTVRVRGDLQHISRQALKQMVLPYTSQGFIGLPVFAMQRKVKTLPWVKNVSITRIWPDIIQLTIKERKPIARWQTEGLVTRQGYVFYPNLNTISNTLPKLSGPQGSEQLVIKTFNDIQDLLNKSHLSMNMLHLSATGAWRFGLTNGILVDLGSNKPLQKLQRLLKVYSKIIGNRSAQVVYIDARYPNGIAVKWRQVS